MSDEFISHGILVFRNFTNAVRSRTVVDHLCFSPGISVTRGNVATDSRRNCFGPLLATTDNYTLPVCACLYVVARPEFVFCFAVTSLSGRLHHQLIKLLFES